MDAGHLVEGYTVPQTYQADRLAPHVVEQIGDGGLAARYQDAVGTDLLVNMGFTGAAGAKLAEVEIIFHQRQQTGQQKPLFPLGQLIRFVAAGAQHNVHPLLLRKGFAPLPHLVHVDVRHLDGGQSPDTDGRNILLFFLAAFSCAKIPVAFTFIVQLHDAPDAAAEQPVEFLRVFVGDGDVGQAQIGKGSKETVFLDVKIYRHHVDDGMAAVFPQQRKDLLRLVGADKVVRQDALDVLHAFFNDFFIVGTAVLPQKKFKDIDWDIGSLFDLLGQILADDLAIEILPQF